MSFIYPSTQLNLSGKTLVVPIVSAANVSQLAVDLLIASLSLRRIAIVNPEYFVPVVGGREDGQEGITTPLELYGQPNTNVLVMQQRSPVLKSRKQDFVDALLAFAKSSSLGSVLFLSGVDLSNRTDSQMLTPTYQIHPPNSPPLAATPLAALALLPIPAYTSPLLQTPRDAGAAIPFVPGGGLTRRMLSSLPDGWPVPTASLLQFVMEGDNRADAHFLATVVAKVVGVDLSIKEWRQPGSWMQGLFGAPHDQTLYG